MCHGEEAVKGSEFQRKAVPQSRPPPPQVAAWQLALADGGPPGTHARRAPVYRPVIAGGAGEGLRDAGGGRVAPIRWFGCRLATNAMLQLLAPQPIGAGGSAAAGGGGTFMYGLTEV